MPPPVARGIIMLNYADTTGDNWLLPYGGNEHLALLELELESLVLEREMSLTELTDDDIEIICEKHRQISTVVNNNIRLKSAMLNTLKDCGLDKSTIEQVAKELAFNLRF